MITEDPYLYDEPVMTRLRATYKKHRRMILAVDFDDTVFPWTGITTHEYVLSLVRRAQKVGFLIVIFTASAPQRYDFIRDYMLKNGIAVDSINVNPIPLPYGNNGKIMYNILLDDRAGLKSAVRNLETFLREIEPLAS